MEKSVTMNLRVNPSVKKQAEDVLKQLGIPMATAIDMYLRQISLTGGIPFSVALPKAPAPINADTMTNDQLRAELQAGYEDMLKGNVQDASAAFERFRSQHL
ncbi:MAG: type II toxin-antitoxin system RelB/DinJ family antitoxin [Clostridia bacterium]|nr:type II toxin-antitoxin system RelB/DinJ family antitoxin [Clostridia bacterium]